MKHLRIIIILSFISLSLFSYAQKMDSRTRARVKDVTDEYLDQLNYKLNHICDKSAGQLIYKEQFAKDATGFFYSDPEYPEDSARISRSFLDTDDTLLRDYPEMLSINTFTKLLKLYCHPDSCELDVEFMFQDFALDTTDYYMDPEIIAVNAYFDFVLYGDLYAPELEKKYVRIDTAKKVEGTTTDEGAIFVSEEAEYSFELELPDRAMATFLIFRNGNKFTDVKIYKIFSYDPYDPQVPSLRRIINKVIRSRNKMYFSVNAGGGFSKAITKFSSETDFKSSNDFRFGYSAELTFDYFFNDGPRPYTSGFSVGVGYSVYNASVSIDHFDQSFNSFSEKLNKNYTKTVDANNIGQDLELSYLDIPITYKLKYKPRNQFNIIFDIGLAVSYLSSSKITPADGGDITYTGTFNYTFDDGTTQEVTYENIPYYGFARYENLQYANIDQQFSELNVSSILGVGAMFWLSDKISLNLKLMHRYGFLNVIDNASSDEFILSEGNGEVNNIFYNSDKINTQSFILSTGISYFLKSNKKAKKDHE